MTVTIPPSLTHYFDIKLPDAQDATIVRTALAAFESVKREPKPIPRLATGPSDPQVMNEWMGMFKKPWYYLQSGKYAIAVKDKDFNLSALQSDELLSRLSAHQRALFGEES